MNTPSVIARAYLEELGLLASIIDGSMEEAQAAVVMDRAEQVAAEISAQFDRLKDAGEMKDITGSYKRSREIAAARGEKHPTWNQFASDRKADMARVLAREVMNRRPRAV